MTCIHVYNWKLFFKVYDYVSLGSCPKISCWKLYSLKISGNVAVRTMRLVIFVYIAAPKIFRIILSVLFVSQETALLALVSWKLWDFRKLLTKSMRTFEGFVSGSEESFPLSDRKWPSLFKMQLRWTLR